MKEIPPYNHTSLLHQVANGSESAFRELFDQYKIRFFAVARKMTGSDVIAEEMVQDIFLKIWQNRTSLTDVKDPDNYFFTALYRQIFRYYKKRAMDRMLLSLISESQSWQNTTDETLRGREVERLINEAVARLSPRQQLVFRLSKIDGLSRDQVAEKLQISPNTVRNHLAEAIQFIRSYLRQAAIFFLLFSVYNL